jgi:hypothetical protein
MLFVRDESRERVVFTLCLSCTLRANATLSSSLTSWLKSCYFLKNRPVPPYESCMVYSASLILWGYNKT